MRGNSGGGRHPAGTDRRALRQALPQSDPAGSRSRPAEPGHSLVAESPGGLPVPVSFSRRPKMLIDFGLRKSALMVLVEGDDIGDGLFITLIVTHDELQFDTHTEASPGSSDR